MLETTATTMNPHSSREISLDELREALAGANPPAIAEILGPQYFDQGHLPGAINLPLEGLAERAQRLFTEKQAEIVVYCASATCQNSHVAQRKLSSLGYQNVRLYRGGKAAWKDAGLPLSTT